MEKHLHFIICFFIMFLVNGDKVYANELLSNLLVYNIDYSNNSVVYEHQYTINNENLHYISVINIETNEIIDILNNNGEYINDDMYFPSISNDGNYIVYTSRADNITGDLINQCYDISDGIMKNCSNVYLYDVKSEKSTLLKYKNESFDGDNYVAKISGNGNVIVFESISTNLVYNQFDCSYLNGVSACINIYKYNILSKNVSLVSSGKNNYGGNSNSISPSISNDGRYITYQSSATNIVSNINFPKYCSNYISNENEVCSYIYLVDTLSLSTKIISMNNNDLFNNNSGNSKISDNGEYVVYESYSTNMVNNGKSHLYLYNVKQNLNTIISKFDNIYFNRDTFLEDISSDAKYISFKTDSTNILNNGDSNNLYVYSINNDKFCFLEKNVYFSSVNTKKIILYKDNNLLLYNIDSVSPDIKDDQTIYILSENTLDIKDKIIIEDNMSNRDKIDIYVENIEILNNVGEHKVFVTAVDEFGNIASNSIKVVVLKEDIEAPIFSDINEIKILKGSSKLNLYNYIQAIDKIDGTTRIYIIDDGNLNLDISGTYKIKLMSKDANENISYKEINIVVYENYDFTYFYEIILIIGLIAVIIFSIIKVK